MSIVFHRKIFLIFFLSTLNVISVDSMVRSNNRRSYYRGCQTSNNNIKPMGLYNDSNLGICYANAVMQCLFQSTAFLRLISATRNENIISKEIANQIAIAVNNNRVVNLGNLVYLVEGHLKSQRPDKFLKNFVNKSGIKLNSCDIRVKIPSGLHIRKQRLSSIVDNNEDILGVVTYSKTENEGRGHYFSFVKMNNVWYLCNDSEVSQYRGDPMQIESLYWTLVFVKVNQI